MDFELRTLTCNSCRRRKIRCSGENPCKPCSRARTLLACEYSSGTSSLARAELPKGAACIPCRQRKRRCDGRRPCLTCKNKSQADSCTYREKRQRREPGISQARPLTSSGETAPSTSSSALVIYEHAKRIGSAVHPPEDTSPQLDISPSWIEGTTGSSVTLPTVLQTTDISRVALRPPDVDYALDPELFSLRTLFLDNCWQYGLSVSPEKREAMARGDTSGAIVHPIFIPVCQLVGYLFASRSKSACWAHLKGQTAGEVAQGQRVLQMLESPTETPDPLTCVQVYKLLAVYCAYKNDLRGYEEFLGNAGNLALRYDVLLGLEESSALEGAMLAASPRGTVEEARSALAHMVYIEMAARIVMKVPPKLPPLLLAKFRRLAVQDRTNTEGSFVKANSVFLLVQSQELVAEWNDWDTGTIGLEWSERYRSLHDTIQAHLHVLTTALIESSHLPKLQVLTLKSCVVTLLAALAEVYALFAPFHAETRRKHCDIIAAVADITRLFTPPDHEYFDCTFEVCLGIVSRDIWEQLPTPLWRLCLASLVFASSSGDIV
ncbi:hypothetical protein FB451DRAFT_1238529 [Mycena latifolia]|nr:hypothetical protein FB451DRAFT_1238529 [Mycena latifolia]